MFRSRVYFALLFLLAILCTVQGCTGCQSGNLSFSSSNQASRGGDGEPLDNKPEVGSYYRMAPGYLCAGNTPKIPARVEVSKTDVKLITVDSSNCAEKIRPLSFDQISHSRMSSSLLSAEEGIYQKFELAPDASKIETAVPEAVCKLRNATDALDVVIKQDLSTRQITATLSRSKPDGTGPVSESTLYLGRDASNISTTYSAAGFELIINRSAATPKSTIPSRLSSSLPGFDFSTNMECRVSSVFDKILPAQPSVAMDFSGISLPSKLNFTRASQGTYFDQNGVLKFASANEPRFDHNPKTLAPLGVLLEEPRTNLLLHSQDLTDPIWVKGDGNTDSFRVTKEGTLAGLDRFNITMLQASPNGFVWGRVAQDVDLVAGTNYTLSYFAEKGSVDGARVFIWIRPGDEANVDYNLANGTYSIVRQNVIQLVSIAMMPVGTAYRVSVTFNSTETTRANVGLGPLTTTVGDWVYATGVQFEVGSQPSSYIATAATTATRAEDNLAIADFSWFTSSQGTFATDVSRISPLDATATSAPQIFSFSNSSGDDYSVDLVPNSTFRSHMLVTNSGGYYNAQNSPAAGASAPQKLFLAYKSGDSALGLNGVITRLLPFPPVDLKPSQANIGGSGATKWNGHVKTLTFWPTRLDDSSLQALSGN